MFRPQVTRSNSEQRSFSLETVVSIELSLLRELQLKAFPRYKWSTQRCIFLCLQIKCLIHIYGILSSSFPGLSPLDSFFSPLRYAGAKHALRELTIKRITFSLKDLKTPAYPHKYLACTPSVIQVISLRYLCLQTTIN